jgi:hypothetical protein
LNDCGIAGSGPADARIPDCDATAAPCEAILAAACWEGFFLLDDACISILLTCFDACVGCGVFVLILIGFFYNNCYE